CGPPRSCGRHDRVRRCPAESGLALSLRRRCVRERGGSQGGPSRRTTARERHVEPEEDEGSGVGPWVWLSGLFGLAILALVAFLIFRLMTGSGATTTLVTVPDFVGKQFAEAQSLAQQSGLPVVQAQNIQSSDKPAGSVAAQDPPANSQVTSGSTIKL